MAVRRRCGRGVAVADRPPVSSALDALPWRDVRDGLWTFDSPTAVLMHQHARPAHLPATTRVRLSEVVAALTCALDITEGQPEGHAARTCILGMRLGRMLALPDWDLSALFYALQLKDLGCSANANRVMALFGADDHDVKRDLKVTDWPRWTDSLRYVVRNVAPGGSLVRRLGRILAIGKAGPAVARRLVQIRCERGAEIARLFGLPEATADAIRYLDEHWDGKGHPSGARGEQIPLLARICSLAQTVEVFARQFGVPQALAMARSRRKRWFDPRLVDALRTIGPADPLWSIFTPGADLFAALAPLEPADQHIIADDDALDRIALGFAQVIDAKSPWTSSRSEVVADLAVAAAQRLGATPAAQRLLRRAALLHDIGMLGVSNLVLDKPGALDGSERLAMQTHTARTHRILDRVAGFSLLADIAASHHERLDGRGYHRGLAGVELGLEARCLVVADLCEALSASRPYRTPLPMERVLAILDGEAGVGLCADAVAAMRQHVEATGFRSAAPAAT